MHRLSPLLASLVIAPVLGVVALAQDSQPAAPGQPTAPAPAAPGEVEGAGAALPGPQGHVTVVDDVEAAARSGAPIGRLGVGALGTVVLTLRSPYLDWVAARTADGTLEAAQTDVEAAQARCEERLDAGELDIWDYDECNAAAYPDGAAPVAGEIGLCAVLEIERRAPGAAAATWHIAAGPALCPELDVTLSTDDLDGDGRAELLVETTGEGPTERAVGSPGVRRLAVVDLETGTLQVELELQHVYDAWGRVARASFDDADGDGHPDLVVRRVDFDGYGCDLDASGWPIRPAAADEGTSDEGTGEEAGNDEEAWGTEVDDVEAGADEEAWGTEVDDVEVECDLTETAVTCPYRPDLDRWVCPGE